MRSSGNDPVQQFAAACKAAAGVIAEWADQTATVTSEAWRKLSSDPAIRELLREWRATFVWTRQDCECACAMSHPDDVGICDKNAVITRRITTASGGAADVPLCAPCAVAQGVAELPRQRPD
jgi:hypothetical protein